MKIKIFHYLEELDCFIVNPDYQKVSDELGLTEWSAVVWIGRYFSLDNDNGEHWFDNWDLREAKAAEAEKMGLDENDLLIIDPSRFQNGYDGPCHPDDFRKRFWTDVLKSLELSMETIFSQAIHENELNAQYALEVIPDLDVRMEGVKRFFS